MTGTTRISALKLHDTTIALIQSLGVQTVEQLTPLNDLDLYTVPDLGPSRIAEVKDQLLKGDFGLANDSAWTQEALEEADRGQIPSPKLPTGAAFADTRRQMLLALSPGQLVHRIKRGMKDRCILPAVDFQILAIDSPSKMIQDYALRTCRKHGIPLSGRVDPYWRIYRPAKIVITEDPSDQKLRILIQDAPKPEYRALAPIGDWLKKLTYDELKAQRVWDRPEAAFYPHELDFLLNKSEDHRVRMAIAEILKAGVEKARTGDRDWFFNIVSSALEERHRRPSAPWIDLVRTACRRQHRDSNDFLLEACTYLMEGFFDAIQTSEEIQ
jgi:hypothetical protein